MFSFAERNTWNPELISSNQSPDFTGSSVFRERIWLTTVAAECLKSATFRMYLSTIFICDVVFILVRKHLDEECTNFPKTLQQLQNTRRQKGEMKTSPIRWATNIRRHKNYSPGRPGVRDFCTPVLEQTFTYYRASNGLLWMVSWERWESKLSLSVLHQGHIVCLEWLGKPTEYLINDINSPRRNSDQRPHNMLDIPRVCDFEYRSMLFNSSAASDGHPCRRDGQYPHDWQ
jgi:hypothetical protein